MVRKAFPDDRNDQFFRCMIRFRDEVVDGIFRLNGKTAGGECFDQFSGIKCGLDQGCLQLFTKLCVK